MYWNPIYSASRAPIASARPVWRGSTPSEQVTVVDPAGRGDGLSYGGDLAWLLAVHYPELVDAAVPMGTGCLGMPSARFARPCGCGCCRGETDAIKPFS
jgi:hypothetical protein